MTDSTLHQATTRRLQLGAGTMLGLCVLVASILVAVAVGAVSVPLPTVVGVLANKLVPGLVEATWSTGREAIV